MDQFRFTHLPITDHKDTTAVLEHLQPVITGLQQQGEALESRLRSAPTGLPSAWVTPEGFSGKLEETTTVQARREQAGTTVRLKGTAKAKEAIGANTTLFTLPVGYRPSAVLRLSGLDISAGALQIFTVNPSGVVENATAVTVAHFIEFDGLTFNLT